MKFAPPACPRCVAAYEESQRAYEGVLRVLRAERAASTDALYRNTKLRAIQKAKAALARPAPKGDCPWLAERRAR